jgi:hypothetical protein
MNLLNNPEEWLSQAHVDIACRIALNDSNQQFDYLPSQIISNYCRETVLDNRRNPSFTFNDGTRYGENDKNRLEIVFQKGVIVALPLCFADHWTVSIVNNVNNTVTYYDSLPRSDSSSVRATHTMAFLQALAKVLGISCPAYVPFENYEMQQRDGTSCGLFVDERVRSIFQARPFDTSERTLYSRQALREAIQEARRNSEIAGRRGVKYHPSTVV